MSDKNSTDNDKFDSPFDSGWEGTLESKVLLPGEVVRVRRCRARAASSPGSTATSHVLVILALEPLP